jgi:hypothetical protein
MSDIIKKGFSMSDLMVKRSVRLDPVIDKKVQELNRPLSEVVHEALLDYLLKLGVLDKEEAALQVKTLEILKDVAGMAVYLAKAGKFTEAITDTVLAQLMQEEKFAASYAFVVGGDPYLHGNQKKAKLNLKIGAKVREAINGTVMTDAKNRPLTRTVHGRVIQSYTPMSGFNLPA